MRLLIILLAGLLSAAELEIRYIAHAAFELRSPGGVRLVLDPYNSHVWLGYRFPDNITADAVLVTHPHFDHDAWYYVGGFPAVFRQPGRYAIGDVNMAGVKGRHADPYGVEFGQINTIWVVEMAGVRLAHLGDNGPLTPRNADEMGRVDILFVPVDETEHILKFGEVAAIVSAVRPRVVVPMHYQLSHGIENLGGIDQWAAKQPRVRDVGNQVRCSPQSLPKETTVYRFQPSADRQAWSPGFWEAIGAVRRFNRLLDRTKGGPTSEQLAQAGGELVRATTAEPGFIAGWHARAVLARLQGRPDEAIGLLQMGLGVTYPDDTERTTLARALLAELLVERGRAVEAQVQWMEVVRTSHRSDLIEKARRGLGWR